MAEKKVLAEFTLKEGGPTLLVEVPKPLDEDAVEEVSIADEQIYKAKESFEEALDKVVPLATTAMEKLKKASPKGVEIKFGLKLSADAGVILSSVGAEVNFEVTMKWGE
ncbi:MAG: CU044_2847 family protein [Cyanobacteria bacterium J06632_3]